MVMHFKVLKLAILRKKKRVFTFSVLIFRLGLTVEGVRETANAFHRQPQTPTPPPDVPRTPPFEVAQIESPFDINKRSPFLTV